MKFNLVDRELNRLHVGIKVSFIRASPCACAANFWNLIRKAFNNFITFSSDMYRFIGLNVVPKQLKERQTPRQMSLKSSCIQLHFRDHAEQNRTNFYFKTTLGSLAGGIIWEKSRNVIILAWQESKTIFALDVHVLDSQNATAGMQQP